MNMWEKEWSEKDDEQISYLYTTIRQWNLNIFWKYILKLLGIGYKSEMSVEYTTDICYKFENDIKI